MCLWHSHGQFCTFVAMTTLGFFRLMLLSEIPSEQLTIDQVHAVDQKHLYLDLLHR